MIESRAADDAYQLACQKRRADSSERWAAHQCNRIACVFRIGPLLQPGNAQFATARPELQADRFRKKADSIDECLDQAYEQVEALRLI